MKENQSKGVVIVLKALLISWKTTIKVYQWAMTCKYLQLCAVLKYKNVYVQLKIILPESDRLIEIQNQNYVGLIVLMLLKMLMMMFADVQ